MSKSANSLIDATESRASFSSHGTSKGAAGFKVEGQSSGPGEFLSTVGETAIINRHKDGFQKIHIGLAWDSLKKQEKPTGFFAKLFKKEKTVEHNVDLDLGCLYELADGTRGCVQAFGDLYGEYDKSPYISLSGDERTGKSEGDDEYMMINGQKWPKFKRILFYTYIYKGAPSWEILKPQIHVRTPGEEPLIVVPNVAQSELCLCVIAGFENVRNGIRITNYTEYFPGHTEMDRAFGFGLEWADGQKL